jgi:hypothetical protein
MEAVTTPPEVGTPKATYMPSRKWIASQVILLTGLALTVVDEGWTNNQWKALIGIVSAALVSYLLPNAEAK